MKKYLSIFAVFLFMFGVFAQNKKTGQTEFFVSFTKGSDTNNGGSWKNPFKSIDRVLEVIGGDRGIGGEYNVYIATGVYKIKTDNPDRVLKGDKKINFIGGFPIPSDDVAEDYVCTQVPAIYPVSFDYEGTNSMFRIAPSGSNGTDLHFEGINYHSSSSYGGIDDGTFITVDGAEDSHVSMENMIISPYNAGQAGFIYYYNTINSSFKANKLFVSDSKFTVEGGGFLKLYGGDVASSNKNIVVEFDKCTFTNNTLQGSFGGSLIDVNGFNHGRNNTVIVKNSNFCSNSKKGGSLQGTAMNLYNVAHVVLKNNRFENNNVTRGVISFKNVRFDEDISGNVWKGNTSSLDGAAIYATNTPITIDGDTFINNTASNRGGAVCVDDGNRAVTIKNSIFCGNKTTTPVSLYGGGAVFVRASSSFLSENNYYNNNFSQFTGGAIRTHTNMISRNDQFYGNITESEGGGIYVYGPGTSLDVSDGQFFNNTANEGVAGAIRTNGNLVTSNNIFENNRATNGNGGAVWAGSSYTSNNDKFKENTSSRNGGAILFSGSQLTINSGVFQENKAERSGGAVFSAVINSKVSADNTMFYKNKAKVDGGALRLYGKSTFNNCDFLENSTGTNGGAIWTGDTGSPDDGISFINSRAYGNSVNGDTGNPNVSDFRLEPLYLVKMVVTNDSKLQMPIKRYKKAGAGEGYILDGTVTQSNASTITPPNASIFTPNEPRKSCGPEENITTVCPTPAQTLDPEALITTDKGTLKKPDINSDYCWSEREDAYVRMFSYTGKPPFIFEYHIVEINGETQQTVIGNNLTVQTDNKEEVTLNIDGVSTTQDVHYVKLKLPNTYSMTKKGITYKYVITKITDADGKTDTYNCDPKLLATLNINPVPEVKAKAAGVGAQDSDKKDVEFTAIQGKEFQLYGEFMPVETKVAANGEWEDSTSVTKWSWTGPNGFTSVEQNPKIIASANSVGTYVLTITDNNGCITKDEVKIKVVLDSDGDGIPNYVESPTGNDPLSEDSDGDGTPDYKDPNTQGFVDNNGDGIDDKYDTDGDGNPDFLDLDTDNDGIPDSVEAVDGSSTDASQPVDTDGDSVPDYKDLDSDNDGINDIDEAGGEDVDGNGMVDNFTDNDGDGLHDPIDNQNLPTPNGLTPINNGTPLPVPNSDCPTPTNPCDEADYRDNDSDGDGTFDTTDSTPYGSGSTPPQSQDPDADKNGDGVVDDQTDTDGDGIADIVDGDPNNFGDKPNICQLNPNTDSNNVKSTKIRISTLSRNTNDWSDSSSKLGAYIVLESSTKGFVLPRMTTSQIDMIGTDTTTGVEEGMIVFDTDANCLKMFFDKNNDGTMTWNCISNKRCNNLKK